MVTIPLPPDFSEFLRLLNNHGVRYLLIGGYAVGYHGYVRATADMDIWVERERDNAERLVEVLHEFGFGDSDPTPEMFLEGSKVIRLGVPPIRIELLTSVSGVAFEECYAERIVEDWDDVSVTVISLTKPKENKRASGRLNDLEYLE